MARPPGGKIVINGWYGHFNAGDDAILEIFLEQAIKRFDCEVVVLSEQPHNIQCSKSVESIFHPPLSLTGGVRALLNGELLRYLKTIKSSSMFVLGGGGLLRDNTSWKNLIRMLDEIWLSKLFGRKVMLYAIGVGPFRSRLGKFLIGASAKMCDLITVRSERGAELLRELGVAAEKIHVVADPAFLLQSEVPQDSELIKLLSSGSKVGVFPALGLVDDGRDLTHAHHLAAALDNLVEKKGLHFIAFPMRALKSGLDDVEISRAIKGAMKHSDHLHVYEKRLTPSELKWVAGKTMMNITVRLHAMIFSLGARVPVVAVNYEPKVSNVFETVGSPEYLVEMDDRMEHSLTKAVEHCLDNLPGYTQKICTSMIHNELAAMQTFELMQLLYCESGKAGEAYLK